MLIVAGIIGFAVGELGALLAAGAYYLVTLALAIPGLAVGIRRLHDTDRSGWWILISVIPLIGPIILVVFLATEGTHGPNAYGPDPKRAGEGDVLDTLVAEV